MRLTRPFLVSLLAVSALALAAQPAHAVPLKVACTGSSSMAGVGSSNGRHIPDELGKALGPDFMVRNFAVAATTAIKSVPASYTATPQYRDGLAFNPDVVLFWFGGNDSWVENWGPHKAEFQPDYTSMVRAFQALPTHPKLILIRLWVFKEGPAQKVVLDQEILPIIDEIAAETNATVIDYRTFIEPHPEWFPDGMHANDTGTAFIGKFFAEEVTSALAARTDAGAPDTGVSVDAARGDDARADALPPTTDVAVAETFERPAPPDSGGVPAAAGTGGAAAGAGGTSAAGGAGGASGTTVGEPPAGGCGCSHAGTPSGAPAVFLLSALAMLARRRRTTQEPQAIPLFTRFFDLMNAAPRP